jgi:thiol-disulfide isomerase/thioredoxin
MQKKLSIISLAILLIFISSVVLAQKKFAVSIHFPKGFIGQKVKLSYNNGRIQKTVPFALKNGSITIADNFYSLYSTITIRIDSSNSYNLPQYNAFYVGEKPASIIFNPKTISTSNDFKRYTLVNAQDIQAEEKALEEYTATEEKAVEDFNNKPPSENDTTWFTKNKIVRKTLMNKQLDFIKQNKSSYYCFLFFKNNIAPNIFMNPDSLLEFYNGTFPAILKQSLDGREVVNTLHGRKIAVSENMRAPDFNVSDIRGNKIRMKDFKGKKYVLINFWASWCGPCVAEMPAIKKISDKYFPAKLEIIANTIDKDSSAFLNALKKYKMTDWANIYQDAHLEKLFGGVVAIPQLFLIDLNGNIIYNRSFKETDYDNLTRLNKILQEKL